MGTRGSALALRQTQIAIDAMRIAAPSETFEVVEISTKGDVDKQTPFEELGPKGIFAVELQRALVTREIDVAVHSLKDLQSFEPEGLVIAAVLERADPRDVLVSRGGRTLADLPEGARVGTSSARRDAELRTVRPDLVTAPLRGNVDTRLRKVADGEVDAAILAAAGIERLGRADEITECLDPSVFVPPPGQGAIAIEARADEVGWLAGADHAATRRCVDAERVFMQVIEGSCEVPLGAFARLDSGDIVLEAFLGSRSDARHVRDWERGSHPLEVGTTLARRVLAKADFAL
ncbi:MAG: hydroxymethylbilane synthase [Actinomycetota bacterium]